MGNTTEEEVVPPDVRKEESEEVETPEYTEASVEARAEEIEQTAKVEIEQLIERGDPDHVQEQMHATDETAELLDEERSSLRNTQEEGRSTWQWMKSRIQRIARVSAGVLSLGGIEPSAAEKHLPSNQPEHVRQEVVAGQEHEAGVIRDQLREELEAVLENSLSEQDIRAALEQCPFIDRGVRIQHLDVINPLVGGVDWNARSPDPDFQPRDRLRESLDAARASGALTLQTDSLNVVGVSFSDIGAQNYGAFYSRENGRTLFVNQRAPESEAARFEDELHWTAYWSEYEEQTTDLAKQKLDGMITPQEYTARREPLLAVMNEQTEGRQTLEDIPDELLKKYGGRLSGRVKQFRVKKSVEKAETPVELTHEATHDFFSNQLLEEGYSGPSMAEILATALWGRAQRLETDRTDFARNTLYDADLTDRLKSVDTNDSEALQAFCSEITEKYDLRMTVPRLSEEERHTMSDQAIRDHEEKRQFTTFTNEYFARIYTGALGHTPEVVAQRVTDAAARSGDPDFQRDYRDVTYGPTRADLLLLRRMSWKGKPILPEKK